MKTKCVVFDLDGTLCELKPESQRNKHTGEEKPIPDMVDELIKEWLPLLVDIYILTGRKEKYRDITVAWLRQNNIPYTYLVMQGLSTAKKNHIFKEEKLSEITKLKVILMVYDDNPELAEVCSRLPIPFYPCY